MKFLATPISGAFEVLLDPIQDHRGFFARAFCAKEFETAGLEQRFVQANISSNIKASVVRGLHFQRGKHAEVKLIRCIAGAIFDVIVDLRPESPSFLKWHGLQLSAENRRAFYVPRGCAHGYQTLVEGAELFYMVSTAFNKEAESGLRFDDACIGIEWPLPPTDVSEKDLAIQPLKQRDTQHLLDFEQ